MIIGGKSALIRSQLEDRKRKGVKHLEVQLFLSDLKDIHETLQKRNWLREFGFKTYAFHTPMSNSYNEPCYLTESRPALRHENMELMQKTILLAGRMSDSPNPLVIIHSSGFVEEDVFLPNYLKTQKEQFQETLSSLRAYAEKHAPRVALAVENMPKLTNMSGERKYFGYGYEGDIAQWVWEMRDRKIGTVLDVCHAIGTVNYNLQNQPKSEFCSIASYLETYFHTLKLIHLSNGTNFVEFPSEHGLPFLSSTPADVEFIQRFFFWLKELDYSQPITIETTEADYNNAVNLQETKKTIMMAFSN